MDLPTCLHIPIKFSWLLDIDSSGCDRIRMPGVDVDHMFANPDQLPRKFELPIRIICRRNLHVALCCREAGHRNGIGSIGGDVLRCTVSVLNNNIGDESFLVLTQTPVNQEVGKSMVAKTSFTVEYHQLGDPFSWF